MFFHLAEIEHWIFIYKYMVLYPIMVIEGPIITIISGLLVSMGKLNPYITYLVLVAGDVTGDSIYYFLGRWTKKGIFLRWRNALGITEERVKKLESYIKKHLVKTLIIGKWSHGIGGPVLAATGMSRVSYIKFFLISLITTMLKTLLLLLCGYYLGKSYSRIRTVASFLDYLTIGITAIICLLLLFYLFKKGSKKFLN